MVYIGGLIMKCENIKCQKEHDGSYGSGRFCCRSCANSKQHTYETKKKISETLSGGKEYKELKEFVYCLNCGTKTNPRNKYCSVQCQQEYRHKQFIERWKIGKEEGFKGKGGISTHIRNYLFEKYDNKCSICGWNKVNETSGKTPLEVEHIDGDHKNNREENLTLLCPNCHSLTSTYKALNKGNGREYRYLLK